MNNTLTKDDMMDLDMECYIALPLGWTSLLGSDGCLYVCKSGTAHFIITPEPACVKDYGTAGEDLCQDVYERIKALLHELIEPPCSHPLVL